MGESLRSAWSGWMEFADRGKLAALLAAVLCYLLLSRKRKGPQGRLILYGAVTAALCVCPVTAALLMKYQTLFYDYPWIWSIVPLTVVMALGGTLFLTEQWKTGTGYRTWLYNAALTLLCAAALVLCGGLGDERASVQASSPTAAAASGGGEQESRARAETVLRAVKEICGTDGCLWAPREILEYARVQENAPRLLYGRNMWDAALNAYSYDVYSEELKELYLWMEHLTDYGVEISAGEGRAWVENAFSMGADRILLPMEMQSWNPAGGNAEEGSSAAGNSTEGNAAEGSSAAGNPAGEGAWAEWAGRTVEIIELDGYYLLRLE